MITDRETLIAYIKEDLLANGVILPNRKLSKEYLKFYIKLRFNPLLQYHICLRKLEYYTNCTKSKKCLNKFLYYYYLLKLRHLGYKCGITAYPNCIGPGVSFRHYGSIIINKNAIIGKNCIIHSCVNIGVGKDGCPIIGDNVYIGPGAKIYGKIEIASNIKIGANAVVNKSFKKEGFLIAGIPAVEIIKSDEICISK